MPKFLVSAHGSDYETVVTPITVPDHIIIHSIADDNELGLMANVLTTINVGDSQLTVYRKTWVAGDPIPNYEFLPLTDEQAHFYRAVESSLTGGPVVMVRHTGRLDQVIKKAQRVYASEDGAPLEQDVEIVILTCRPETGNALTTFAFGNEEKSPNKKPDMHILQRLRRPAPDDDRNASRLAHRRDQLDHATFGSLVLTAPQEGLSVVQDHSEAMKAMLNTFELNAYSDEWWDGKISNPKYVYWHHKKGRIPDPAKAPPSSLDDAWADVKWRNAFFIYSNIREQLDPSDLDARLYPAPVMNALLYLYRLCQLYFGQDSKLISSDDVPISYVTDENIYEYILRQAPP